MRRGAALRLVVLAELVLPAGGAEPRFSRPAFTCLCPHAPTRTHELSRVPMGSHLTPITQIQPASLALTHPNPPKNRKNENFRASGYKTGRAVASRCYIR